jgi:hypothetical protein
VKTQRPENTIGKEVDGILRYSKILETRKIEM